VCACGIVLGKLKVYFTCVAHIDTHSFKSYGFSDNGPSAEMGHVSDALRQALEHQGEEGPYVLVGAGYGG
jgi:hypothetical protein